MTFNLHLFLDDFLQATFSLYLIFCTLRYSAATRRKAMWAYRVFTDWKVARNQRALTDSSLKMITGDLLDMPKKDLVYALSRFVLEVKKKTGQLYPTETLYELVIAVQMYCHMNGKYYKFIDDVDFLTLRNVLNNRMRYLAQKGYTCPRQKAEAIDVDDENQMWETGVLGDSNPKQLVDTLLYMLGVHFALRAVKEHKALRVGPRSQFAVKFDRKGDKYYLEYTEDSSKTNQGGLEHRKVTKKISRAYENLDDPQKCVVRLYRKYMTLRPTDSKCPEDLYLRPLVNPKETCWYTMQPMGVNTISKIVSHLAKQVGIEGKVTNHSCRATSATRLFQSNMEEQLVMEKTGHRSNAVRSYKRTSDRQLREVSNVLYGKGNPEEPDFKKLCTTAGNNVEGTGVTSVTTKCETMSKPPDSANTDSVVTVNADEKSSQISFNFTINVNK